MRSKLIDLAQAAALVPDGACLSFGGFTTQRHPMAFVYELLRLRRRVRHRLPGAAHDHYRAPRKTPLPRSR